MSPPISTPKPTKSLVQEEPHAKEGKDEKVSAHCHYAFSFQPSHPLREANSGFSASRRSDFAETTDKHGSETAGSCRSFSRHPHLVKSSRADCPRPPSVPIPVIRGLFLPPGPRFRAAFTLVELLVATAVFLFLMLILVSVVGAVSESWTTGRALAETQMRSRAILDLIGRDLRNRVASPTLPAFDGGRFHFYTLQAGSSGGNSTSRRLTFIDYNRNANTAALHRDEADFKEWGAPAADIPLGALNTPNLTLSNNIISEGIPGFAYAYLLANGTYTTNVSTNSPIAVRISLAVLDELATDQLRALGLETELLNVLQSPTPDTKSPAALWKSTMDAAEWKVAGQSLPPKVRRGLRFFERTYPLGNP